MFLIIFWNDPPWATKSPLISVQWFVRYLVEKYLPWLTDKLLSAINYMHPTNHSAREYQWDFYKDRHYWSFILFGREFQNETLCCCTEESMVSFLRDKVLCFQLSVVPVTVPVIPDINVTSSLSPITYQKKISKSKEGRIGWLNFKFRGFSSRFTFPVSHLCKLPWLVFNFLIIYTFVQIKDKTKNES